MTTETAKFILDVFPVCFLIVTIPGFILVFLLLVKSIISVGDRDK
jgi:hypothetical protein